MSSFTITVDTDVTSDAPTVVVTTVRDDLPNVTRSAIIALDAGATDFTADVASLVRMHLTYLTAL